MWWWGGGGGCGNKFDAASDKSGWAYAMIGYARGRAFWQLSCRIAVPAHTLQVCFHFRIAPYIPPPSIDHFTTAFCPILSPYPPLLLILVLRPICFASAWFCPFYVLLSFSSFNFAIQYADQGVSYYHADDRSGV